MTEKKEELKPCPLCGSKELSTKKFRSCSYCGFSDVQERWEEFYCWKEISRLEAEVERLKGIIEYNEKEFERIRKEKWEEHVVCDCHTWPSLKEFHEYTEALEKEFRDECDRKYKLHVLLKEERQKSQEALARLKEETEKREALEIHVESLRSVKEDLGIDIETERQRREKLFEAIGRNGDRIQSLESQLSIAKEGLAKIAKEKKETKCYGVCSCHTDISIAEETLKKIENAEEISLCPSCTSMTKTIEGRCGKCKETKGEVTGK